MMCVIGKSEGIHLGLHFAKALGQLSHFLKLYEQDIVAAQSE